jgi:hypothetical protein
MGIPARGKRNQAEARGWALPCLPRQIAIRSDHPSASSSRSYHLAHPTSASTSRSITGGLNSLPATLFSTLGNWTTSSRVVNSVRNSVGNIRAHYDISNRMFASFLSADVSLSMVGRTGEKAMLILSVAGAPSDDLLVCHLS